MHSLQQTPIFISWHFPRFHSLLTKKMHFGPKIKILKKKIIFDNCDSVILDFNIEKNPKTHHPRIGQTEHQKISFGPRIQFLK